MGIVGMIKGLKEKILPSKEKIQEKIQLKNSVPKEKENIKKSFAIYCNANHGTKDDHLCSKCTALLMRIMPRMARCPYGQLKPICEKCDIKCHGKDMDALLTVLDAAKNKMLLKNPGMAVKHRLLKAGTQYVKDENEKKKTEAARAKRKMKREKKKNRVQGEAAKPTAEKKEEK